MGTHSVDLRTNSDKVAASYFRLLGVSGSFSVLGSISICVLGCKYGHSNILPGLC